MNALNELKFNPLEYVATLESPVGIYLRKEILKKKTEADTTLTRELYKKTVAGQSADGSWDQLFVRTANNLWNLALLGDDAKDKSIKQGLNWLLSIQKHQYGGYPGFFYSGNRKDPSIMRSTFYGEFGPGCTIFYQTTYAIHLFHIFGFDDNKQVQTAVKSYLQFWRPDWCAAWCTINVLRMLIEHPLSRESKQVENGLEYLAKRQTKTGAWEGFPFYHTFHAISRSHNILATKQFGKAFSSVIKRQNKDGCGVPGCKMKECAKKKETEYCFECGEFPCPTAKEHCLQFGEESYHAMIIEHEEFRKLDIDAWAKARQQRAEKGYCSSTRKYYTKAKSESVESAH